MPQERMEKGKRVRACTICGRSFKRTEHCIRHERAHFRERPFSCRFCDKSYGRKDLLVRHERTLHADEWASAQAVAAPTGSQNRSARRRQSRNSWGDVPVVPPAAVTQYKPESQRGLRISNETVIQYESFLPSPRVSSSSEISDPEPVSGISDGFDLDIAPDTNFAYPAHMIASEETLYHISSTHMLGPRHFSYDSQMQLPDLNQFNCDHGFPLDPSLTMDDPKTDFVPRLPSDAEQGDLNFFSLFPGSIMDDQILLLNQVTSKSLVDRSSHDIFVLDAPTPEPRRRGRPPRNAQARNEVQSRKVMTEETRLVLLADLEKRLVRNADGLAIPVLQSLRRFMNEFFKSFNSQLPIFHIPSFDISSTPSPLLLAMCSIGALFDSERDVSNDLRELAKEALNNIDPRPSRSLWEVQCKLLLIVGAAFGGNCCAVAWAQENVGFLHREFSRWRSALSASQESTPSNWATWIEQESLKRLLFGMFIVSSLLTIAYNVSPGISISDMKIEMPEEENIWSAVDEERWEEAMGSRVTDHMDINEAVTELLFGKQFDPDSEVQFPAFAMMILMHAVNVHMWHITQSTQSFMNFSVDAKAEEQMKALCTSQTEESLARCLRLLERGRFSENRNEWRGAETPLLFNSMALLRSCYVRVFTGSGTFNRTLLFSDDGKEISRAVKDYVQIQQVRTPFLTKAVARVFDDLLTPIRRGHHLATENSAFAWSIEHAIAVWDCALFYTKWVHTIDIQQAFAPPDRDEKENLDNLVGVLQELNCGDWDHASLAPSTTKMWASLLDNNWTWEVTNRMGRVLRELADVYEIDRNSLGTPA